jgi:YVTN family beta-propeller protein
VAVLSSPSARVHLLFLIALSITVLIVSTLPTLSSLGADRPARSPPISDRFGMGAMTDSAFANVTGFLRAGSGPFEGAVDPTSGDIYVTDAYGNNVSVFSSSTGRTLATIPVGYNPWGVAIDPRTNDAFVANRGGNVSVIRGLSVVRTILLGPATNGVLYDPIANLMYVTQDSPVDPNASLAAISPRTDSITAQIPLGTGCFANLMTFDSSDGDVYVTLSDCNEVAVINASTTTLVGTIQVGNYPLGITFDPTNSIVYVVDYNGAGSDYCASVQEISGLTALKFFYVKDGCDDGTIAFYPPTGILVITNGIGFQVYHDSTAQESVNFPYGPQVPFYDANNGAMYLPSVYSDKVVNITGPWFNPVTNFFAKSTAGLAATPSGDEFVAQYESAHVDVVSEQTQKVLRVLSVGSGPYGVTFDPGTNAIYVTDALAAEVTVINATTWTISARIAVGNEPEGIAYDPVHHEIDIANFASNTLTVISDRSNQIVATVPVGNGPDDVDASTGTIYVSDSFADRVSVVSATTLRVVNSYKTLSDPQGLSVDQGNLYVADEASGKVSVFNLTTGRLLRTMYVGGNPISVVAYLGSIFVSDPGFGAVYEFSGPSVNSEITYLASHHPYFLAVDGTSGRLLVSDFLSDNEIVGYQLS